LAAKYDGFFPTRSDAVDRELCNLLVYWKSSRIAGKAVAELKEPREPTPEQLAELLARNPGYGGSIRQMLANLPDAQQLHYLFALRNLRDGWKVEDRTYYYQALQDMRKKSGGASYQGFLRNIEKDAWENTPDVQQVAVEAAGLRQPFKLAALPKPQGPGADWTMDKLLPLSTTKLAGRDFKNGQKMFAAARCVICHRFAGEGGATGPDLTQLAGRFNFKDLCESIVDPSKVVSDQYRGTVITTTAGQAHSGRVILEDDASVTLFTDPEDSTKTVKIAKKEIDERKFNAVSLMPKDLLKPLNESEVLDLLAYMLSRGNPNDALFRK
jgi:putative heme-binding domain-containing protein